MSEALKVLPSDQSSKQTAKYFSFQIKGWTIFDPMDKTLGKISERIEGGDGFLTLVETLRVETDIAAIDDEDVRECFENLHAAKRLIQNMNELPAKVKEELRAALRTEDVVPNNNLKLPPESVVDNEPLSRIKRWP
jgi:hypothetical protein